MSYGNIGAQCDIRAGLSDDVIKELYGELENTHVDAVDEAGLLGYRNEIHRAYEGAVIVLHPGQGLKAS